MRITLIQIEEVACPQCRKQHSLMFAAAPNRKELVAVCQWTGELVTLAVDEFQLEEVAE